MKILIFVASIYALLLFFAVIDNYSNKKSLLILQIGNVNDSVITGIKGKIEDSLNMSATVIKRKMLPSFTWSVAEKAYYGDDILDGMNFLHLNYDEVLIITENDLYSSDYLLGLYFSEPVLGLQDGNSAIITTHSLSIREELTLAYHELGHSYGLSHCKNTSCYMHAGTGKQHSLMLLTHYCIKCQRLINNHIQNKN